MIIHGYIFYSGIFIVSFNYGDTHLLFTKMLVTTMSLAIIRPFSYVYQSFGKDIREHRVRALVYHQMKDDINLLRDGKEQHEIKENLIETLKTLKSECTKRVRFKLYFSNFLMNWKKQGEPQYSDEISTHISAYIRTEQS